MAVRRISDLPELYSNYPSANLSSCLFEVSYNPRDQVYQSFYVHGDKLLSSIIEQIAIPEISRASKTEFGAVKIGDNINVIENGDDKGLISVNDATQTQKGVIKSPGPNIPYLGTNYKGEWEAHELSLTVETVDIKSATFKYYAIDTTYPVGAFYIAGLTQDAKEYYLPPGFTDYDGENQNIAFGPTITLDNGSKSTITWRRHNDNYSIWTASNNLGGEIDGHLPPLPTFTCKSAGAHTHAINDLNTIRTYDVSAQKPGAAVNGWNTSATKTTSSSGSHTHTVTPNTTYLSYGRDGDCDIVRPNSIGCAIWVRVPDTII